MEDGFEGAIQQNGAASVSWQRSVEKHSRGTRRKIGFLAPWHQAATLAALVVLGFLASNYSREPRSLQSAKLYQTTKGEQRCITQHHDDGASNLLQPCEYDSKSQDEGFKQT